MAEGRPPHRSPRRLRPPGLARRLASLTLFSALALGGGCKGKKALPEPAAAIEDPTALAAAARARPLPEHLKATYALKIDAPSLGVAATISGATLISQPDRFRVEIYAPLVGPRVYMAADGEAVNLYVVSQKTYYAGSDAESVLRELTVGAAGLEDVVALLVGRMPFEDAVLDGVTRRDAAVDYAFASPRGASTVVTVDDQYLTPQRIVATSASGVEVLVVDYADYSLYGDAMLPGEIQISVPGLDMRVEMKFKGWEALEESPDVYAISAPPLSRRQDLLEAIDQWGQATLKGEAGEDTPDGADDAGGEDAGDAPGETILDGE